MPIETSDGFRFLRHVAILFSVVLALWGCRNSLFFDPPQPSPLPTVPTFSPAAGTYASDQSVTISDATSGAKIYYTVDGSTPTSSSPVYSTPISISGNGTSETIKAIALEGGLSSTVASATYIINIPSQVAAPVFMPGAGTYSSNQSVTISDATSGATIYYTVDGSTPTNASTMYGTPISISGNGTSETIKAIGVQGGFSSAVASATYDIDIPSQVATPVFAPGAGTYTSSQSVTISDATSGATIYYMVDGSTPTTASPVYSTPISISGNGTNETVKALAAKSGYTNSAVASASYTISYSQVSTPHFSVATGTYSANQSIVITDSTAGSTIYYTTDGSSPTTSSAVYGGPIAVNGPKTTETINALAAKTGLSNSIVASATYTILYQYQLTVSPGTGGTTSPSGSNTTGYGAATAITATPSAHYAFANWTVTNGVGVSLGNANSASTTVTLTNGNAGIQANFIYTEYVYLSSFGGNCTSAFWINPGTGALTAVSGSPFATGNFPGSIAVSPAGNFVYVADSTSISANTINPNSGALTAVSGSPWTIGTQPGEMTVDPTGKFLYVADVNGEIDAFTIDSGTGALTAVSGSPFATGTTGYFAVAPTGKFLYNTGTGGQNVVSAYSIDSSTGALTEIGSSPTGIQPQGVAIDPTGEFLYVANIGSSNVSAFTINTSTGALTAVSGSPFAAGVSLFDIKVDPTGHFVYSSDWQTGGISAFTINTSSGALTAVSGSPFAGGSDPRGIAIDSTGKFIYAADPGGSTNGVLAFKINTSTGALTAVSGSPFTGNGLSQAGGVAIKGPF
jgi:6-phosphogluconolactonase (cycloisomerase 2 family)